MTTKKRRTILPTKRSTAHGSVNKTCLSFPLTFPSMMP